nr:MAG TPA: hypothetical protein [Caudoviricetes sp.]
MIILKSVDFCRLQSYNFSVMCRLSMIDAFFTYSQSERRYCEKGSI